MATTTAPAQTPGMRFSRLITLIATTSAAATLAVVPAANAADQYFLKLDGVTGDASIPTSSGLIQVNSFELGAENPITLGTATGAGSAKTALKALTIERNLDSASPVIFQKLAQGAAIPGMELVVRRVGPTSAPIVLRYQFQAAYLTGQTQSAETGDSAVSEKLVFTYAAVRQSFMRQSASGATLPANTVSGSWNQIAKSTSMLVPGFPDTSNVIRIAG